MNSEDRQKIHRVLRALGMTQSVIAERIGASQSALSRWINGEKTLNDESQSKLLALVGCTFETILIFDDPVNEQIANRVENA